MKKIVSLFAGIALVSCFLLMQQTNCVSDVPTTNAQTGTVSSHDTSPTVGKPVAGKCPELPEGLISILRGRTERQREIEKRVALSLQNVGKNLVLEHTRGAKEIAVYQKVAPAVVFVATDDAFGSGAIIDSDGHIITNWHVVKGYSSVVVVFKPKDSAELTKELAFSAHVEKTDQVSDLALLKISNPPETFAYLGLGDSSNLSVGQDVHAIGHPSGEIWTYTKGIISQIRSSYEWRTSEEIIHRAKVIQTQTPINPGSSGGPLLDDKGALIGINSFQRSGDALNYAVAVDAIKDFLQSKKNQVKQQSQPSQEIECSEVYDTTGQGWPNVMGCYAQSSSPPPDFWFVFLNPDDPPLYMATDAMRTGQVNTVTISEDQKWESLWHYMDVDCDGIVDLIGHQFAGKEDIDSYRKPSKILHLKKMAKEFNSALEGRQIPYPKLQVCQ